VGASTRFRSLSSSSLGLCLACLAKSRPSACCRCPAALEVALVSLASVGLRQIPAVGRPHPARLRPHAASARAPGRPQACARSPRRRARNGRQARTQGTRVQGTAAEARNGSRCCLRRPGLPCGPRQRPHAHGAALSNCDALELRQLPTRPSGEIGENGRPVSTSPRRRSAGLVDHQTPPTATTSLSPRTNCRRVGRSAIRSRAALLLWENQHRRTQSIAWRSLDP
jgi:hypothetical protein